MIKYCVNEEKDKVTAYFYDNSDYRGKALWRKYLSDTVSKVFRLYNSFVYVDADKLIDKYLKDVNVTCVVTIKNNDVDGAKELVKERLIKKYARCEDVVLHQVMMKLNNDVNTIRDRYDNRCNKILAVGATNCIIQ